MNGGDVCECPMDGVNLLVRARKDFAASMFIGTEAEILAAMRDVRAARAALGQKMQRLEHLLGHPMTVSTAQANDPEVVGVYPEAT